MVLEPLVLEPLVVGPDQVPLVTDPDVARTSPDLAVLSALAHGTGPGREKVFKALLAALDAIDEDRAERYADLMFRELPAAARNYLEVLMSTSTHRYNSDFARHFFDRGEASGEVRTVLAVLSARGIEVPDHLRADIVGCTDADQLEL